MARWNGKEVTRRRRRRRRERKIKNQLDRNYSCQETNANYTRAEGYTTYSKNIIQLIMEK